MSKSTWIAAVVFVALLVTVVVTLRQKPERGITRVSFADVVPAEVTRIEGSGKHAFTLERSDDGWRLADGRPADPVAVERLVGSIPKIESATVVTQTPQRFAELQVDEAGGLTIAAFAGDREVARFIVGTNARGGLHVREGTAVYVVRGIYGPTFQRDEDAWLDREIFTTDPAAGEKVEVRLSDGTEYALVAREDEWSLEDPSVLPPGFRFDPLQARGLARSVQALRAKSVLVEDPGPQTTGLDLDDAVDVFGVVAQEGEPQTLTLGASTEDGDVYARASGRGHVFTIAGSTADGLRKTPLDFRDLGIMTIEPADVTRLEIRSGAQSLTFTRSAVDEPWRLESSSEEAPEDFELDPNQVSARLVALSTTRAFGLGPSGGDEAFAAPSATLVVTTIDGETATLALAGEAELDGKTGVLARGNADDLTYVLSEATVSNLTGGLETFRKTAMPPGQPSFDAKSLEQLPPHVRAELLRQMQMKR